MTELRQKTQRSKIKIEDVLHTLINMEANVSIVTSYYVKIKRISLGKHFTGVSQR